MTPYDRDDALLQNEEHDIWISKLENKCVLASAYNTPSKDKGNTSESTLRVSILAHWTETETLEAYESGMNSHDVDQKRPKIVETHQRLHEHLIYSTLSYTLHVA